MPPLKTTPIIIFAVIILFILFQTVRTMYYINTGVALAKEADAVKYEQSPANSTMNVLIIGDSTVVGVGASTPEESIAGLVGKTVPDATIVNKGINGRKTASLPTEIESLEKYDLIMLHIGGNDVVRRTGLVELEKNIRATIQAAKKKSPKVMLTSSGSLGTALLLPFGTRNYFEQKTRDVRRLFLHVAQEEGIPYVDLFREKNVDPFHTEPEKYYSPDLFHPSSIGYALWFERIEPVLTSTLQK
ncbi:TPA: hypothetical protein HA278_02510 [Candidatus Woesearchaeota archaeon]|nr:hypothetical protein [archaeon]HIJ10907.1 hypothetical protein [Candidatus Woesearchaeota archaeon]